MASPADRLKAMLNKRLFVVDATPTDRAGDRQAIFGEHLDYIVGLEQAGLLFASGPILGADGAPSGRGLTILDCGSLEEAERIVRQDPYVRDGFREANVREWRLMEGRLSITLDCSTGQFRIG